MLIYSTIILLALSIILPFGYFYFSGKQRGKASLIINLVSFFGILLVATIAMFVGAPDTLAETTNTAAAAANNSAGLGYIAAALVTGIATIATGIAVASSASAALGALSENPDIFGKAIVFVGLAEGIAIYGVLISFMILNKI